MGCFCHHNVAPLSLQLSLLADASLSATLSASPKQQLAEALAALLAQFLAAHGLPAQPWAPDPAWLSQPLPQVRLSAQAMATISAFAQLRAQALAQFGIDLLVPQQATALARIVATMSARLQVLPPAPIPTELLRLAALLDAIEQVTVALKLGLLLPVPAPALLAPAGIPINEWAALLNAIKALAPLIATSIQMKLSLNASFNVQLAAALRVLRGISLPALPQAQLTAMASLTASLSAVAQLRARLGIDPLKDGIAPIRAAVSAQLVAMLQLLPPAMRSQLQAPNALEILKSMLPRLPYCPTNLAPPAVVQAALSANAEAIAAMDWQVPSLSAVPLLAVGLPTVALVAQIDASLGLSAVLAGPCGSGCDAARLMKAIAA
jgi:hypothetical protein